MPIDEIPDEVEDSASSARRSLLHRPTTRIGRVIGWAIVGPLYLLPFWLLMAAVWGVTGRIWWEMFEFGWSLFGWA